MIWRLKICLAFVMAFTVLGAGNPVFAQTKAGDQLKDIEKQLEKSKTRAEGLAREVDELSTNIDQLRSRLVKTATRVQTLEANASFMEDRLSKLAVDESRLQKLFVSRRQVLAELLVGLQRLEQNPLPALAVKPEDALSALRGAMLMGIIVPEIRIEASGLAENLQKLNAVRKSIATERTQLAANLKELAGERAGIRKLLLQKRELSQISQAEIEAERFRSERLSRETRSLKDLITKLGPDAAVKPGVVADSAERTAVLRNALRRQAALLKPGRLFSQNRGRLSFPAQGIRVREFGAANTFGGPAKGLSIATRRQAQVTTPIDGRIVYAGPFRGYGQLLIIGAGEGYHVLLAGMERINVDVGQFVLAGEPIGVMGQLAVRNAVIGGSSNRDRPILYIEFRKDGTSIDPRPWWAGGDEKARG